ncbi:MULTISPECIES: hypothetical protein [unclassified Microcoleus]
MTPPINTFGKFHRVQVFISGRIDRVAGIVNAGIVSWELLTTDN